MTSKRFVPGLFFALLATTCSATLYNFSGINAAIPDGNPAGWSDTRNITVTLRGGETTAIRDINVHLDISGGYNGDLYAYLVHSTGFAVLLNRPGRTGSDPLGYSDPGMTVILDDQLGTDIHSYAPHNTASPLTSPNVWAADGRNVDPATAVAADSRTALLNSFNGLDANGSWTLFLADMVGGDQATINGWGVDITLVPEPVHGALLIFGLAAFGVWTTRRLARTKTS